MLQQLLILNIGSKSVIISTGGFHLSNSTASTNCPSGQVATWRKAADCIIKTHWRKSLSWDSDCFRVERNFSDNTKYVAYRRWEV